MTTIAIIGTAGRDKTKPMTLALWKWMLQDAYSRVPKGAYVVSGGAAWADHLAVSMMLFGHAGKITLYLPAPFVNGKFEDSNSMKSAGNAANYYHKLFSETIDRDTLGQIGELLARSVRCDGTVDLQCEPASPGIGGMFARNAKVAKSDQLLAYTFGPGDQPADGGTLDTWNKCQGHKTHIPLPYL